MPGQADLNVIEVLNEPSQLGRVQFSVVEILHGTVGTIPAQAVASHTRVVEVLAEPSPLGLVQSSVTEVLWEDLTFEFGVDAQVVEILHGTVGTIPVQEAASYTRVVEILAEPSPLARTNLSLTELLVSYDAAVASVSNIFGPSATPATFDGTPSLGFISSYRWDWVSVPGGSLIGNSVQPFPNSGGVTPIDMTGNEALYHAEETVGVTGADTSGNGVSAPLTAITVGVAGHVGSYAWNYTGTTSKAQPTGGIPLTGDYTISFWFFNLAPSGSWRTGAHGNGNTHYFSILNTDDRLGAYSGSWAAVVPQFDMPAASYTGWHHILAVGSGGSTTIYVDGVLAGVSPRQSSDTLNAIGNYQGNNQRFADRIDEVAIWSRALSSREASEVYVLQLGTYAGVGSMHTFTPDVDGTYTINLTVVAGLDGALTVDTADAFIGATAALVFPLQGDSLRMWAHLQGSGLRNRDEN